MPCESSMELLRLTAVVARASALPRHVHVAQAVGVVLSMDGGGAGTLAWQRRSSGFRFVVECREAREDGGNIPQSTQPTQSTTVCESAERDDAE
jgi:hypothetical protein